jgi:hypothetical protein
MVKLLIGVNDPTAPKKDKVLEGFVIINVRSYLVGRTAGLLSMVASLVLSGEDADQNSMVLAAVIVTGPYKTIGP